ncbi:MAG: hypothetical protein AB9915_00305 [Candidatus Dojkabacteria bacterium]
MADEIKDQNNKNLFVDSIAPGMNKDEFIELASKEFTSEDQEIFGDDYQEQMLNGILYFSVSAPYPVTFDSNAIAAVVDDIGSSDLEKTFDPTIDLEHTDTTIKRTQHIIERAIELGIIEMNEEGRFYIKQETIDKLLPILQQF